MLVLPLRLTAVQKLLVDMAVLCMPNIESLQVEAARSEEVQYPGCGHDLKCHFGYVYGKIIRSVDGYITPPSCQHLPSLCTKSANAKILFLPGKPDLPAANPFDERIGDTKGPGLLGYVIRTPQETGKH